MSTKTNENKGTHDSSTDIPTSAARGYITDMLAELCTVAEQSGQEDLHVLLKLTAQAALNTTAS